MMSAEMRIKILDYSCMLFTYKNLVITKIDNSFLNCLSERACCVCKQFAVVVWYGIQQTSTFKRSV